MGLGPARSYVTRRVITRGGSARTRAQLECGCRPFLLPPPARRALTRTEARSRVEMGASLGTTASGAPARFPVGTWIAAGACLAGLALSERFIVGPLRKQQEAEGTAPSTSIFGDIAVVTGEAHTKKSQAKLPDGLVLMDDGSIKRKP